MTTKKPRHLPPVGSVWGDPLHPLRWWVVMEHDGRAAIMARWADPNTERVSGVQFWQMVEHYGYQRIDDGNGR